MEKYIGKYAVYYSLVDLDTGTLEECINCVLLDKHNIKELNSDIYEHIEENTFYTYEQAYEKFKLIVKDMNYFIMLYNFENLEKYQEHELLELLNNKGDK